ncbi:MAG: hypothetical protein JNL12_02210 [Planctomycetes bacterium]|nr:hypothetical protein [Planctomycetota bacterium]
MLLAITLVVGAFAGVAAAQTVTGATVSVHASGVPGPVRLAFAADGTLYCGRDLALTGTGTPLQITKVGPGGTPVQAFGTLATPDPDVVAVDALGTVSGIPGSVLTGGIKTPNTTGSISAVHPDGSVAELWTSNVWVNPADLKFDASGRLLFADQFSRGVWQSVGGGVPTLLFTLPNGATPFFLAVAPDQRIFVCDSTGRIRSFSSTGTLLNGNHASLPAAAAIEFAPGSGFGNDLYALGLTNGLLHRIAADGTVTAIGSGFGSQTTDLAVGPDGNLYYASFGAGEVRKLTPAAVHESYGTGCHGPAPLTLAASPAPVLNPGTLVTYTVSNIPEYAPGSGLYVPMLFLSVTPTPGGVELLGQLTTMPGCFAYIATLDVSSGLVFSSQPTVQMSVYYYTPLIVPGAVIAAQAAAVFDGSFPLPNGEAGGVVVSNGIRSSMQLQ